MSFNSVTGSIGIPALVETTADFVFQRHIAILKPDVDKASGSFIARLLGAPQILEQAREVATGTAQLTIPLSGLRAFRVPLPTSTEQEEIVRRVDAAFAWLDKLASEHARAASLLPKLDQAILAKAFRGELVPQDPSDEPASELLERIRATGGQQPHRRRARKPRSDIVPRAPRERAAMTKSRYDDDVRNKPYLADLLRQTTGSGRVEDLFKRADLTVADFYKQLKWEVDSGHIRDDRERLEAA